MHAYWLDAGATGPLPSCFSGTPSTNDVSIACGSTKCTTRVNSQGNILAKGNIAEISGDQIGDCNGFYCEDHKNISVEIEHTGKANDGWICDYIK